MPNYFSISPHVLFALARFKLYHLVQQLVRRQPTDADIVARLQIASFGHFEPQKHLAMGQKDNPRDLRFVHFHFSGILDHQNNSTSTS